MAAILIVDACDQQTSVRFEEEIRPHLPPKTRVDVVEGAAAAKKSLAETAYPVVILEHMVAEPLVDGLQSLMAVTRVQDLVQPAHVHLPDFIRIRPESGFIVVSHGKGAGPGKERAKCRAFPQVLGVFGWIRSKGTAKAILKLILPRLG